MTTLDLIDQTTGACCGALCEAPLTGPDALTLAPVFKALGDPTRLRLYSMIACCDESCVCDLAQDFDASMPTISHHLKVLREAGLVTSERRGTWVYYRAVPALAAQLSALLMPAPVPAS